MLHNADAHRYGLPIFRYMANMGIKLKTTFEISDSLLRRAKRHARQSGKPLRVLVEDGLRLVLDQQRQRSRYRLPDRSVGRRGDPDPLAALSWPELRDEIYGGR
jgi:hypothetical protein